jgi:hypothetical protein
LKKKCFKEKRYVGMLLIKRYANLFIIMGSGPWGSSVANIS